MNTRIQELIKQASSIEVIHGRGFDETQYIKRFSKEKFAELIVRECAKIADSADESACEWIGGNILTHFGVEE